jgi:hypothetical protein
MLKKYVTDALLAQAASAGGIEEVRIAMIANGMYVVSVKIQRTGERLNLATHREPNEARQFKRIEAATKALNKLIGAKKFVLVIR